MEKIIFDFPKDEKIITVVDEKVLALLLLRSKLLQDLQYSELEGASTKEIKLPLLCDYGCTPSNLNLYLKWLGGGSLKTLYEVIDLIILSRYLIDDITSEELIQAFVDIMHNSGDFDLDILIKYILTQIDFPSTLVKYGFLDQMIRKIPPFQIHLYYFYDSSKSNLSEKDKSELEEHQKAIRSSKYDKSFEELKYKYILPAQFLRLKRQGAIEVPKIAFESDSNIYVYKYIDHCNVHMVEMILETTDSVVGNGTVLLMLCRAFLSKNHQIFDMIVQKFKGKIDANIKFLVINLDKLDTVQNDFPVDLNSNEKLKMNYTRNFLINKRFKNPFSYVLSKIYNRMDILSNDWFLVDLKEELGMFVRVLTENFNLNTAKIFHSMTTEGLKVYNLLEQWIVPNFHPAILENYLAKIVQNEIEYGEEMPNIYNGYFFHFMKFNSISEFMGRDSMQLHLYGNPYTEVYEILTTAKVDGKREEILNRFCTLPVQAEVSPGYLLFRLQHLERYPLWSDTVFVYLTNLRDYILLEEFIIKARSLRAFPEETIQEIIEEAKNEGVSKPSFRNAINLSTTLFQ